MTELEKLDRRISGAETAIRFFALAEQVVCYELQDRLAALRVKRVELVKNQEENNGK